MKTLRRAFRARTGREEGLSLIELLIAISITGIIMGPIGFAFYFGLHSTADTQTRLIESNKANVFASFFTPDVQNAVTVGTNVSESAAACGTPLGTPVALLLTTDAGGTSSVSYYRGTGVNQRKLYRRTCSAGAVTGTLLAIENLDLTPPSGFQTLSFTCNGPLGTSCSQPNWQLVQASLTQSNTAGKQFYPTTLQATRRIS